jgi:hypothetical protein
MSGSDPSDLTNVNGTLFFSANDGTRRSAVGVERDRRRYLYGR